MTFDDIKQILELMREHDIAEFELERDNVKLRLRKNAPEPAPVPPGALAPAATAPVDSGSPVRVPAVQGPEGPATVAEPAEETLDLAVVKSPIVGTFYRATEPGARPFAEIGDVVRKGQVLCIIEAMKLMNEINAEYDGEVVKVYVENGQPVQYGERLFAIKPS
jgi:acetyl-CoA carboxylase biotin carboxyl carrier protein